jgi:molybdate transport system substrate-binding protein
MAKSIISALVCAAFGLSLLATSVPTSLAQDAGAKLDAKPTAAAPLDTPVAAAASLRIALDEIAELYEAKSGNKIKISYGATGNLVRQIEEGAPFELFLAADEASVQRLEKNGKTDGAPLALVDGRLAIAVPKGSTVKIDGGLAGLKQALADGTVKHISIANPELAPYGKAASQALNRAGLWDQAQPLLVQGENIGQAAQFVATGAAEVGFVAQSLMFAPDMAAKVDHAPVDPSLYAPIRQGMALLKNANTSTKDFFAFLKSQEASAVFEKNGFAIPK